MARPQILAMARARLVIRIVLGIIAFAVSWLVFWSVDYERGRRRTLSATLSLEEAIRIERSAFTLAGHAAPAFALPWPSRSERVVRQKILRGTDSIWGMDDDVPLGLGMDAPPEAYERVLKGREPIVAFVSPDDRTIVLAAEYQGYPLRVLDVATRRVRELPLPADVRPRSDYEYELRHHAWGEASRHFFVRTQEGADFDRAGSPWYREVWRVDLETLGATRVARCEIPWERKHSDTMWNDTPCAHGTRPNEKGRENGSSSLP